MGLCQHWAGLSPHYLASTPGSCRSTNSCMHWCSVDFAKKTRKDQRYLLGSDIRLRMEEAMPGFGRLFTVGGRFALHSNPLHPGEEQQTMLNTHWDKARASRVAEQGGDGQAQDFAPILRQLIYIRDGVLKERLRNVAIETINQV